MVLLEVLSILSTPVTEIVKGSIAPVVCQIGYVVHCKKNIDDLGKKLLELESMNDDVKGSVEAAERGGQVIKTAVRLWLEKVDTIEKEVKRLVQAAQMRGLVLIETEVEEERLLRRVESVEIEATQLIVEAKNMDGCFKGGWCYRYSLGKEAKLMIGVVDKLLNERNFDNVSDPPLTPTIESMYSGDFEAFQSTKSAMKKVMDALKDERINIVGVYGMGGVGKTTLMKEVAKQVKNDKIFDEVVMATVSQNPDLKSIQGEIAEKLGLPLLEKSKSFRARRLAESLKREKRILVILDDVWRRLELAEVGILNHKGCKAVLTTRRLDVCNTMMTQKNNLVNVLSEQDSWHLFHKNVGDVVNSPALHEVAWKVVKECGGLPIALVTLGRAMRGKDNKIVWEDVATKLRKSMPIDIEDMDKEVCNSIKLSYDYLESEETKKCFLFCCLFSDEHQIHMDRLMMYVMGEALLEDVHTLDEARGRLHTMVDKLIASSLLLKSYDDGSVMIHDIVRDVAISIAKEDINGFIVKAGTRWTQWPPERKKLSKCMRMSLMENKINELPTRPECPQLLTLSLRRNRSLKELPDSFFESMKSLVTLDLSYTSISSLPPSISCLVNLRTLCLDNCELLRDVSLIGKLKNLEILNLAGTNIRSLPEEIRGLTNLKLLNLSYTDIEIIQPNVISSLSHLEELYMNYSFSGWESERMGDGSKASFNEVVSLTCLTTLYLKIKNVEFLSEEIPNCWKNLTKFEIRVGNHYNIYGAPWSLQCMLLDFTLDPIPNWVKLLLQRIEKLILQDCKGCKNVLQVDAGGFNNLKSLDVKYCHEMKYLMSVVEEFLENTSSSLEQSDSRDMDNLKAISVFLEKLTTLQVFGCKKLIKILPSNLLLSIQNLEELHVYSCPALEEVFNSEGLEEGHITNSILREEVLQTITSTTNTRSRQSNSSTLSTSPPPPIFLNLRELLIRDCRRLKHLFPTMRLVRGLQQLEKLEISKCDEMEQIIVDEDEGEEAEENDKTVLPRLENLKLTFLEKLSSFFQRKLLLDWPSLETLHVEGCLNLKMLPLGPQSAPKLKEVIGDDVEWLEGLEWEDESVKLHIQLLFSDENRVFDVPDDSDDSED